VLTISLYDYKAVELSLRVYIRNYTRALCNV